MPCRRGSAAGAAGARVRARARAAPQPARAAAPRHRPPPPRRPLPARPRRPSSAPATGPHLSTPATESKPGHSQGLRPVHHHSPRGPRSSASAAASAPPAAAAAAARLAAATVLVRLGLRVAMVAAGGAPPGAAAGAAALRRGGRVAGAGGGRRGWGPVGGGARRLRRRSRVGCGAFRARAAPVAPAAAPSAAARRAARRRRRRSTRRRPPCAPPAASPAAFRGLNCARRAPPVARTPGGGEARPRAGASGSWLASGLSTPGPRGGRRPAAAHKSHWSRTLQRTATSRRRARARWGGEQKGNGRGDIALYPLPAGKAVRRVAERCGRCDGRRGRGGGAQRARRRGARAVGRRVSSPPGGGPAAAQGRGRRHASFIRAAARRAGHPPAGGQGARRRRGRRGPRQGGVGWGTQWRSRRGVVRAGALRRHVRARLGVARGRGAVRPRQQAGQRHFSFRCAPLFTARQCVGLRGGDGWVWDGARAPGAAGVRPCARGARGAGAAAWRRGGAAAARGGWGRGGRPRAGREPDTLTQRRGRGRSTNFTRCWDGSVKHKTLRWSGRGWKKSGGQQTPGAGHSTPAQGAGRGGAGRGGAARGPPRARGCRARGAAAGGTCRAGRTRPALGRAPGAADARGLAARQGRRRVPPPHRADSLVVGMWACPTSASSGTRPPGGNAQRPSAPWTRPRSSEANFFQRCP
jgi:hypothetical protein